MRAHGGAQPDGDLGMIMKSIRYRPWGVCDMHEQVLAGCRAHNGPGAAAAPCQALVGDRQGCSWPA